MYGVSRTNVWCQPDIPLYFRSTLGSVPGAALRSALSVSQPQASTSGLHMSGTWVAWLPPERGEAACTSTKITIPMPTGTTSSFSSAAHARSRSYRQSRQSSPRPPDGLRGASTTSSKDQAVQAGSPRSPVPDRLMAAAAVRTSTYVDVRRRTSTQVDARRRNLFPVFFCHRRFFNVVVQTMSHVI